MHEEEIAQQEFEEEKEARKQGGVRKRARPLERESVDGFHARVTSEDNHEFEVGMKQENKEWKERMEIVYQSSGSQYGTVPKLLENVGKEQDKKLQMERDRKALVDTPLNASDQFTEEYVPLQLAGGDGKAGKNSLFFSPQDDSNAISEQETNLKLLTSGEDNESTSMKLLQDSIAMPPPSSIPQRTKKSNQQLAKIVKDGDGYTTAVGQLVEYTAKPIDPQNEKQVIPSNTRFPYQQESRILTRSSQEMVQPRSTTNTSRDLASRDYESDSTSTDLDAPLRPLAYERRARQLKLESERNRLVAMTPVIVPRGTDDDPDGGIGAAAGGDQSPIMTWGDVASTPLVHGGEEMMERESNSNGFQLQNIDKRESIAMVAETKLAEKTKMYKEANAPSQSHSKRQKIQSTTIYDRSKSLTPAARSLLERSTRSSSSSLFSSTKRKVNARESSSLSSALRSSYTPTHGRTAGKRKIHQQTPRSSTTDKEVDVSGSGTNVRISGLLNMP